MGDACCGKCDRKDCDRRCPFIGHDAGDECQWIMGVCDRIMNKDMMRSKAEFAKQLVDPAPTMCNSPAHPTIWERMIVWGGDMWHCPRCGRNVAVDFVRQLGSEDATFKAGDVPAV